MLVNLCKSGDCSVNVTKNRCPTTDDNSCNASGEGIFCLGSIWVYDPTLPNADIENCGNCLRVFYLYGEDCTMYQWLEVATKPITFIKAKYVQVFPSLGQTPVLIPYLKEAIPDNDIFDEWNNTTNTFTAKCDKILIITASVQSENFVITEVNGTPLSLPADIFISILAKINTVSYQLDILNSTYADGITNSVLACSGTMQVPIKSGETLQLFVVSNVTQPGFNWIPDPLDLHNNLVISGLQL